MNKLSLDEIGFIKKRIQQFIDLPASPKWQDNHDNKDLSSSKIKQQNKNKDNNAKNTKKVQIKESPKKIKSGSINESKSGNQDWIKIKQKQIQSFINQQNRNKVSVLNKFLHSQKIHFKKRQQVEPDRYKNSREDHELSQQQQNKSKHFSFEHQLADLNKAYKKVDSILVLNQVDQNVQNSMENYQDNQTPTPYNQDNFSRLLKHIESDASLLLEKVQDKPKPIGDKIQQIQPVDVLIKPSTIKGKNFIHQNNQVQTPKLANPQIYGEKPNPYSIPNKTISKPGILKRSNSQLSLEKRNKSPQKGSNYNKPKSNIKAISKEHSHKSLQRYFDDQNTSSIQQTSSKKGTNQQKRNCHYLNDSTTQKFLSLSRKRFPASVYRKSFKQNPYGVSNQQKFFINKYKAKQLSPDERRGLKQKYELLDKRLDKILTEVKREKEVTTPSFVTGEELVESRERRSMVPEEIIAYKKLSPLRMFLAINKDYRDQASLQF